MKILCANRMAPDGTPRSAASHLGLFCLPMSHKRDARLKRVKCLCVVITPDYVGRVESAGRGLCWTRGSLALLWVTYCILSIVGSSSSSSTSFFRRHLKLIALIVLIVAALIGAIVVVVVVVVVPAKASVSTVSLVNKTRFLYISVSFSNQENMSVQ